MMIGELIDQVSLSQIIQIIWHINVTIFLANRTTFFQTFSKDLPPERSIQVRRF